MKKIASIFLISFSLLISCNKNTDNDDCPDDNEDLGLISASIDFGECQYKLNETTFIVQNNEEYLILQETIKEGLVTIQNCTFPEINFEDYTLLGQYAEASGCTIDFNRNVAVDSTAKYVDYIVLPEACGLCEMMGFSYNFILIYPKISPDYDILFNGKHK